MKKPLQIFLLAGVVILAGCFSLETTPLGGDSDSKLQLQSYDSKTAEHVIVSNFGWYFFNRWPIVCGNANVNRSIPWVFFRNDVDENVIQNRLVQYATARDCDIVDLHIFNNAEVLMSIGVGGVSLPLPYILSYRELQYSCSLVHPRLPGGNDGGSAQKDAKALREEMLRLLNNIPDGGSK